MHDLHRITRPFVLQATLAPENSATGTMVDNYQCLRYFSEYWRIMVCLEMGQRIGIDESGPILADALIK